MRRRYKPGEPVVYRKIKRSTRPGPRARDVHPASKGEEYCYRVDKFWTIVGEPNGQLLVATRRGKRHLIDPRDGCLRPAHWWERLLYRDRFPQWDQAQDSTACCSLPTPC
ncbi:MAG: hypothetical protein KY476_26690 [Planctomycetes bacterium]|nr:hypothetical protein [Planctomycetota bacterium]